MRILVVDDSTFMRKAITKMIESDQRFKVIDIARNGEEALEKIRTLQPDIVTLDIEMPITDGMSVLNSLRTMPLLNKPAVLVCSTLTKKGSVDALAAMRLGAADYVNKDPSAFESGEESVRLELLGKIRAIGESRELQKAGAQKPVVRKGVDLSGATTDAILIGSSTGGPPVLETILTSLPASLPVPVVIAQHMPLLFTKSLSERLNAVCQIGVVHGESGMKLKPGCAYLIPGGLHGRVIRGVINEARLELSTNPTSAPYRPSVDELMSSGAETYGARALGVVLTGMGQDGAVGAIHIRTAGGRVLAQAQETCVVYGMPKAVVERDAATAILSPTQIGEALATITQRTAQSDQSNRLKRSA